MISRTDNIGLFPSSPRLRMLQTLLGFGPYLQHPVVVGVYRKNIKAYDNHQISWKDPKFPLVYIWPDYHCYQASLYLRVTASQHHLPASYSHLQEQPYLPNFPYNTKLSHFEVKTNSRNLYNIFLFAYHRFDVLYLGVYMLGLIFVNSRWIQHLNCDGLKNPIQVSTAD